MEVIAVGATLGLAIIAGIVWLIRLEGRVNVQAQQFKDLKTLQDEKLDSLKELIVSKLDESNRRLSRIELAMNGRLHKEN